MSRLPAHEPFQPLDETHLQAGFGVIPNTPKPDLHHNPIKCMVTFTDAEPEDLCAMDDRQIEEQLRKASKAPRIDLAHIDNVIVEVRYHHFPGTTLIVCALELKNGFQVTGESACADPANFNVGIGNMLAFRNAKQKIWALEGYLLRQRLHEEGL